MSRAALVLAGGEATRFQTPTHLWQDKALAQLNDKPFLVHIIENLQNIVDTIAVCVNSQQRETQYRGILEKYKIKNVKYVLDQENSPVKGPLLAILSGLQAVTAQYCLVVPTDMPFLNPKIANYLFEAAEGFEATTPMWPDGTLETLLMALERKSCLEIVKTLIELNRDNVDTILRAASTIRLISPLQEIRRFDQEFRSFININSQQDLFNLKTRSTDGPAKYDVCFDREKLPLEQMKRIREAQKMLSNYKSLEALNVFADCACHFEANNFFFWAGTSEEKIGETQIKRSKNFIAQQTYARAAGNYQKEALLYQVKDCTTLSKRAQKDREFCATKTGA